MGDQYSRLIYTLYTCLSSPRMCAQLACLCVAGRVGSAALNHGSIGALGHLAPQPGLTLRTGDAVFISNYLERLRGLGGTISSSCTTDTRPTDLINWEKMFV